MARRMWPEIIDPMTHFNSLIYNPLFQADMTEQLEQANEKDLKLAAEAVVDAAIWRYRLRADTLGGRRQISEETRASLIELVFNDPSLTPFLFQDEAWERH